MKRPEPLAPAYFQSHYRLVIRTIGAISVAR